MPDFLTTIDTDTGPREPQPVTLVSGGAEVTRYPSIGVAPAAPAAAVIANAASLSGAIDLGENRLHAIVFPAGWTAASLTFEASADGAAYAPLYDQAAEISAAAAGASRVMAVAPAVFAGFRYLKLRSGTAAAPVNQLAERTFALITVPR